MSDDLKQQFFERAVRDGRAAFEKASCPTDEQIRGFLERDPEYLRRFLDGEARARQPWFVQFIRRENRIAGGRRWDAIR